MALFGRDNIQASSDWAMDILLSIECILDYNFGDSSVPVTWLFQAHSSYLWPSVGQSKGGEL